MNKIDQLLAEKSNGEFDNPIVTPAEEYKVTTLEQYRKFNDYSWDTGIGYTIKDYPIFDNAMEGLQSGLYLFAAESNAGKSALVLDLMLRYCENEDNKLFGLYFSLDDTEDKLIPRMLSSRAKLLGSEDAGVPISLFSKPQRYIDELQKMIDNGEADTDKARVYYSYLYEDITGDSTDVVNEDVVRNYPRPSIEDFPNSVRGRAYQWLNSTSQYFKIVDGTKIRNGEQLIDYCNKVQEYIRTETGDNSWNIIVGIDSLSDITWETQKFSSDKEMNDYTSRKVKQWSVEELKCPIFGSIHLRKIDQKKKPTIADVKESGRWVYEATLVFVIHNDVSRMGENAKIRWRRANSESTDPSLPVLEVHWAKNKQSSFKGYTFFRFEPNFSRIQEADEEQTKRWLSFIYAD